MVPPLELLSGASRLLFFRKRHPARGSMPGTLVIASDPVPCTISVVRYGPEVIEEEQSVDVDRLSATTPEGQVQWIDVQGLGDENVLRRLGELFGLHPLALEDAVNVPQRPKCEAYDAHQLFISRMARQTEDDVLDIEQVSIFLGATYVLTLQERHGDLFDPIRRRLRAGRGPIRVSGPDYLAYAIIDAVLDGYYPVVETIGEQLHDVEEEILDKPSRPALRRVHALRRQLLALRRAVWPQREAVAQLMREDNGLVTPAVRQYLRDCHDHAVQIADVIETYREFAGNLMDMYLSGLGQRTNEVMKVLTIMASIFIPLTFLAGLYGMNFDYLPELHVRWAYPALLGLMAIIAVVMLIQFKRRGWIGSSADDDAE
jgi:magnesium transporter